MNTFGRLFRVNIFGESHGKSVGVNIDGCPAGIPLSETVLLKDLERRKSGAVGTSPRKESDLPQIISGTFRGKTTGAPITIVFENANTRSRDYSKFKHIPRPGHADFVAMKKYGGYNDYTGSGHFSGRITSGLVAAGALAKKIIEPVEIHAKLLHVAGNENIDEAVDQIVASNDSAGGLIECKASKLPIGLGEPFFDSAESLIAHAVFAVPAVKGIEFGAGFDASRMRGSQHNDALIDEKGTTKTNNSGGINGGITNGNDIVFRVAVKPTSSIALSQQTFDLKNREMVDLRIEGRHDACIALRTPVIIEAATAIVLADLMLLEQNKARIWNV